METKKPTEASKEISRLELNKKFYNLSAVKESLKDFRQIGNFKLEVEEDRILLTPLSPIEDPNWDCELCNYILALMKNNSMV